MHLMLKNAIMSIDTARILGFRPTLWSAGPRQNRLDDLLPQHEERGQSMESFRYGFVPPGPFAFADDVFAPQLLQVVRGHARSIHFVLGTGDGVHLCGKVGSAESSVIYSQFNHSFDHGSHPGFVDVDTADPYFTNTGRSGQIIQLNIGDAGNVDAVHGIQKPIQDIFQVRDDLSKPIQETTARQYSGIVGNDLDPEGAFAFGITLGGDLSEVDLEHRQVMRRSLDHDLLSWRFFAFELEGTSLGPQDGLQCLDVETGASSVDNALKDLIQFGASHEQEVSAVLPLVNGEDIPEPGFFLVRKVQRKTQTGGVNPTLAHLTQAPYSVLRTQGVCDKRQAPSVGDRSETIAGLDKTDSRLLGLQGNIFMTIEDELCIEGRMTTKPDGDVSPFRINDMERIVVHIGHRLFSRDIHDRTVLGLLDIPYRGRRPVDQNEEDSREIWVLRDMLLGKLMLPFPLLTIDNRNSVILGIRTDSAAQAACHTHEMLVIQLGIGAVMQCSPPETETRGRLPHWVVCIQNDSIHAVINSV